MGAKARAAQNWSSERGGAPELKNGAVCVLLGATGHPSERLQAVAEDNFRVKLSNRNRTSLLWLCTMGFGLLVRGHKDGGEVEGHL